VNTQSQLAPGTYTSRWNGRRADGTPEQEGTWAFTISALDDLQRSSAVERDFTLDDTLGAPRTIPPPLVVPRPRPRPVASFTLTRQARVTERIETPSGVVIRALGRVTAGPGKLAVAWNGTTASGGFVYPGRYVAHVIAVSAIGTSELTARFLVLRK